jgi:acetyl-CoA synthetase
MTVAGAQPTGWEPTAEYLERSRLLRFMKRQGIATYEELYTRSVTDLPWFWDAVVRDELGLEWLRPYSRVLDLSDGPAWPRWFDGGRFNFVPNAVDRHVRSCHSGEPAIIWEGEEGQTRHLTYGELHRSVDQLAAGLQRLGVTKGDCVGIFMPMVPETAVAILATAKIGALSVPVFSGYGVDAVATRLRDAEARLLITADGFYRRGRLVPMKETADGAVGAVPSIEHVVVCRRAGNPVPWTTGRDIRWEELVSGQVAEVPSVETAPDDPFMVVYTSGTTGPPKGAVHVHAGFPIKAAQDLAHCFDVQPSDRVFWLTDIGWVMGPLVIVGTLILGGTIVLYDGTPDSGGADRLWHLVERHRITVLGLSPTAIRALMSHGDAAVKERDLSSLRILGSSGEPWNTASWLWYFRNVGGGRCPIINYSGGTEVTGGILGCTTLHRIRPCSFTTPIPGMAADVIDDDGSSVRGKVGELVMRQPWVGMTRGFWRDQERYIEAYWSRFPGIWTHGDWARVDDDGLWYILGRSDDTLKVAGKRVGPAEVESAATSHPAVQEAAAIGVPHDIKHETITLFVMLQPGVEPDGTLKDEIRQLVGAQLGKALIPSEVRFVSDLPRTRNGKILRRLIRAKYLGQDLGDLSVLDNHRALQAIAEAT